MPGLGRGLDALIVGKPTLTSQVLPHVDSGFSEIAVGKITQNPHQPRREFAEGPLAELAASIKEHGVLQPILVTKTASGYELVAGERRLRAAKLAGLKTVPAVVRTATEQKKLELALIENIQRQSLNALEEATAYQALVDEFHLTQAQVAERVGKSRPEVANTLRLLELEELYKKALVDGKISRSHARTLLSETNAKKRQTLFETMLGGKITVRQAEASVIGKKNANRSARDPNMAAHETALRQRYGTRVDIAERAGKGTIQFYFYKREELADLLDQLSD